MQRRFKERLAILDSGPTEHSRWDLRGMTVWVCGSRELGVILTTWLIFGIATSKKKKMEFLYWASVTLSGSQRAKKLIHTSKQMQQRARVIMFIRIFDALSKPT